MVAAYVWGDIAKTKFNLINPVAYFAVQFLLKLWNSTELAWYFWIMRMAQHDKTQTYALSDETL